MLRFILTLYFIVQLIHAKSDTNDFASLQLPGNSRLKIPQAQQRTTEEFYITEDTNVGAKNIKNIDDSLTLRNRHNAQKLIIKNQPQQRPYFINDLVRTALLPNDGGRVQAQRPEAAALEIGELLQPIGDKLTAFKNFLTGPKGQFMNKAMSSFVGQARKDLQRNWNKLEKNIVADIPDDAAKRIHAVPAAVREPLGSNSFYQHWKTSKKNVMK